FHHARGPVRDLLRDLGRHRRRPAQEIRGGVGQLPSALLHLRPPRDFVLHRFQLFGSQAYALPSMSAKEEAETERRESQAPRVRDLPAPRRSESVIGPLFRLIFKWPYRVGLAG